MLPEFPPLDLLALCWFLLLVVGYELVSRLPAARARNITSAVQAHRRTWMLNMAAREVRIVDAQLLASLSSGNAFFASTSVFTIGGLAALLGAGDRARVLVGGLPYAAETTPLMWELKVLFLIAIMVFAFFKFAWAFRLSHYTVIMVGATPEYDDKDATARREHAERTASLLGIAGDHANRGLRAFYYAIAGLAWFYHPVAFMLVTANIVLIMIRREYFSRSRGHLRSAWPQRPTPGH